MHRLSLCKDGRSGVTSSSHCCQLCLQVLELSTFAHITVGILRRRTVKCEAAMIFPVQFAQPVTTRCRVKGGKGHTGTIGDAANMKFGSGVRPAINSNTGKSPGAKYHIPTTIDAGPGYRYGIDIVKSLPSQN